jgi:hypothetical protein
MEGEHSLALEVVTSEPEVPQAEATATGSSSEGDSSDQSRDGTSGQDEVSGAVDLHKSDRSYGSGPSTVTVSRN